MIQFDCALDGVSLSSLNGHIRVTDIMEDAPRMHETALALHGGGQRVLRQARQSISVRVRFAIQEEAPAVRSVIASRILRWAMQGGSLTITNRPGQRLHVVCTGTPDLSANDWTEALTLVFTSTFSPWWEDADVTSAKGTTAMSLAIPGNAASTPVEVVLINTSAVTVNWVTITCGESRVTFEDIALPTGGQLVISQVDGAFTAKLDGVSILHRRTMDSADELLVPCGGTVTMSTEANTGLYAFYNVRGRYL